MPEGRELPVLDVGVVRERADAARNRARVLAAAERLFAERGVAGVTMDEVAAAAGVGKGTLYRRFVDRAGLAVALLDDQETQLQQGLLSGPPPLGPGADPVDRLAAFVDAYVRFVSRQLELLLLSETARPGARFGTGAYAFWRLHCRILLAAAGVDDPDLAAEALLAALSADQVRYWLQVRHLPLEELAAGLAQQARRSAAARAPSPLP